ncbi:putative Late embryogenesis abundant protein, LEA_1 subgroup [Helianthus annuus]|nr:putative Late embryogenesis abundant protein, LEA_1 subgroup [Helianthus annuus]
MYMNNPLSRKRVYYLLISKRNTNQNADSSKKAASVKETAADIGASAKSGIEKTEATMQEKGERMTAHDPTRKEMATKKKEDGINQAEYEKQVARKQNATQRLATEAVETHSYFYHKSHWPSYGEPPDVILAGTWNRSACW